MKDLVVKPRGNDTIDGKDIYLIRENVSAVKFTATGKDNSKGGKDWKSDLVFS